MFAVVVVGNSRVSKFLLVMKYLPTAVYINESEAIGTRLSQTQSYILKDKVASLRTFGIIFGEN